MRRGRRLVRWVGMGLLAGAMLLAGALGFGMPREDARLLGEFAATVERFRTDPEFRQVGAQYIHAGSRVLQGRVFGAPAGRVLYTIRRMPGLPKRLAANDHLALHYQHFSEGPLSAYLHLTAQQGMGDAIGMLEALGRKQEVSDEDARAFLSSFDVWPAVATDGGAVASVRKLIGDVEPGLGFAIRGPVDQRLGDHIRAIALARGFPPEPQRMTPDQQRLVLESLDEQVMRADPELWRAKQVNDFLNGVWGQTFGRSYARAAQAALAIWWCGRVGVGVVVGAVLLRAWRRRFMQAIGKEAPAATGAPESP